MLIKEERIPKGSKAEVKRLCEQYGYKLTKYEEITIKGEYGCTEIACNNGSLSIAAKPNYNYTYSSMQICTLWGRIIDAKRQIDALNMAMELQAKIAEIINAVAID